MAGLNHDFFLLSRTEHPVTDYSRFINDPRAVVLHDDLIDYLYDTLHWIPSFNPARGEPTTGLCRCGVTVIQTEGASQAAQVFSSWADLFSVGPKSLRLTGGWTWIEGQPDTEGEYARLVFDGPETIGSLRRLAAYARQVAESDGDLYILHIGI